MAVLDEKTKIAIVRDVRAGLLGTDAIAEKHGASKAVVVKIRDYLGVASPPPAPKNYDSAARKELLNRGFERAAELLEDVNNSRELQYWVGAVALLIDRKRMEDGEATHRVEYTDAREQLEQRINDLKARRAETEADVKEVTAVAGNGHGGLKVLPNGATRVRGQG